MDPTSPASTSPVKTDASTPRETDAASDRTPMEFRLTPDRRRILVPVPPKPESDTSSDV